MKLPWKISVWRSLSPLVFFTLTLPLCAATVSWVGGSGDWNTAANWSTGTLPETNDDVIIDRPGDITVTHTSDIHTVRSILSQEVFWLSGGSLTVSDTMQVNSTFNLSGTGTLRGATVFPGANGQGVTMNSGTLDGVTMNGDLDVGKTTSGARLTVLNGLVLNGTLYVGNPGNQGYGGVSFSGSQTLSGTGTVVFGVATGCNALNLAITGTVLTIGPGIILRGQGGVLGYAGCYGGSPSVGLINQGTIAADVAGGTLTINAQPFVNSGVIRATNGATLNLSGTLTTKGLGTFQSAGGAVKLAGLLDNSSAALVLDGPGNLLTLQGGTVRGGSLAASNGAGLVFGNGTLDGVTVNGDLDVGDANSGASLTVVNGLVLNGTLYVGSRTTQWYGAVSFAGSQTLSGIGTVVFGNQTSSANNALRVVNAGTTLTLGPAITVRGQAGTIGYSSAYGGPADVGVVNQGTIAAGANSSITLNSQSLLNLGDIRATGGGALNLAGTIQTAGLGVFHSAGGAVRLTGLLDNSNAALVLDGPGNVLTMQGGTIRGGSVAASNGAGLVFGAGTLDGVTMNADLDVGRANSGASLAVLNGLVLNGTLYLGNPSNQWYAAVSFAGSQTLGGNGTVVFGNQSYSANNALRLANAGTTLTLGPDLTVRGQNGIIGYSSAYGGPANVGVVNQSTIAADINGGTILTRGQSFSSSGKVEVQVGATLDAGGSCTVNGSAQLSIQAGGTLKLTGDLLGNTASTLEFMPAGTTVFDGSGTPQSPQLLEAMSQDVGSGPAGFAHNFAYGTLALANNTYVKLIDAADNSPGTTAEALYANSLVVPAGTTLDLSGLHLYARATQIAGAVANGSVGQIPDGGTIAEGVSTAGALGVPGELDEWTFFGRAGENVTVVVDTGSGSVLAPRLGYGDVRLVGPAGDLLARASNTVANQTIALSDVAFPSNGIYRIQVRASAAQSSSTGNYLVTLWKVIADVAPLPFNQTRNGRIETPYSVDRWTFSAAAGQQVRFVLVNVSAPGVAFDLRGPNGWIGFSNLVGDSGLLNLPEAGGYTLTVHSTGGAYDLAYAFKLLETVQTDLVLGTSFTGYFAGSGQAQVFRISLTNAGPLRITLANGGNGNLAELYFARGALPTRGAFDYQSATGPGATRDILVPNVPVGTHYVLVYGDYIPTPGSFTIQAMPAGLFLTATSPGRQANNSAFKMTLVGAGFQAGASVELLAGTGGSFPAPAVSVDSFTQLTASFPTNLAPPGLYSVRVRQPDGNSAILANAFEMLSPGEPRLETRLIMPSFVGPRSMATIYVEYANTGTASMPAPLLLLKSADPDGRNRPILTLDQSRVIQNFFSAGLPPGTANQIFILGNGAQPGVLNPGERMQVPVYYLGMPWDGHDFKFEMEIRYWTTDDPTPIDWAALKDALRPPTLDATTWDPVYVNLTAELATMGDYVRMLDKNAEYLGQLGQGIVH